MCCTRKPQYINEYGSNSKFPSTGPGSRVRVQVPEYGSSINNYSTCRFPSTDPGSRVRVKVPEYGSKFPSTGQSSRVRIFGKIGENHQISKSLKNNYNLLYSLTRIILGNLSCPKDHRIQIWSQNDCFQLEILGREVGPISVTLTVLKNGLL